MTGFVSRRTEYDKFLYAIVAESEDLPITVLSMLSRLNIDPWLEAARLTQLPRQQAVDGLSENIQRFKSSISPAQAGALASKLTEHLPARDTLVAQAMREESADFTSMWLIFAVFFTMMALSQGPTKPHDGEPVQQVVMEQTKATFPQRERAPKEDSKSRSAPHIQH